MEKLNSEAELRTATNGKLHLEENTNRVHLKKQLGVLDGASVIVGVIVGSGIFISPKGVLYYSGSFGLALIIWILSGALSMIGALCYAELGTMIPKSGGDYTYIKEAYGNIPAFLYMYSSLITIMPTGNAINALTFSQYFLEPLMCSPPAYLIKLVAALTICLLTVVNCYNVKWVAKAQDVLAVGKIVALGVIIVGGFTTLFMGKTENIKNPMAYSNYDPGHIALAFYSGIFSFSGWNYLNFVTDEIKNPHKNLPRAICVSMPLISVIYVLVNAAYFVVLTREEVLSSEAVAVTFGERILGRFSWIIPLSVVMSTFGSLNSNIFATSRLFFIGAQNGHLPKAVALISIKRSTPIPSLIILGILSIILLSFDNVYSLINYTTIVESLFTVVSISGLLWFRYKKPDIERPIKVNLVLPLTFFVIFTFLCILPFYVQPFEVTVGILIVISGIPLYIIFIHHKTKWKILNEFADSFNEFCAKVFGCALEDKEYHTVEKA